MKIHLSLPLLTIIFLLSCSGRKTETTSAEETTTDTTAVENSTESIDMQPAPESDVADLEVEKSADTVPVIGETVTEVCVFSDYSIGDCGHMLFDCGDFGDAQISEELDEESRQLWQELVVSDDDGERGNPEYVGKNFEITYQMITGTTCGEPDKDGNYYRDGPVALIMGFKLK